MSDKFYYPEAPKISTGGYIPGSSYGTRETRPDLHALYKVGGYADAVNPGHYKFPGGFEVKNISMHLTSMGGQALQYIARSCRLDGANKHRDEEDIEKAIEVLKIELKRKQDARRGAL